jgi:apolipoprotein D and lipocalin family protein
MFIMKSPAIALLTIASVAARDALRSNAMAEVNPTCPPPRFGDVDNFDFRQYFNGSWYSLKQQPAIYQQLDTFFCTQATYTLQPNGEVNVLNYATKDEVNGAKTTANLRAFIPDVNVPNKGKVGQPWLPKFLYGDYWVVDAGSYAELEQGKMSNFGTSYDWAIVSGTGEVPSNGKCVSGLGYFNFKGFWLFSRLPTPPAGIAEKIEAVASAKGLDTSVLRPIVHKGCTYEK